ncbi:sporulation inhibitor of replication protein SirA [Oceanobacillus sp. 143]|nr:sporulation inhibitor of replication protein SirA [Oceanobacillus sp. 143]
MYEYSIYRIREEIANHYYHKSDILYRFLKEYESNKELLYLHGQFLYITNKFTQKIIELYLNKFLSKKISYKIEQSKIKIFNEKSQLLYI